MVYLQNATDNFKNLVNEYFPQENVQKTGELEESLGE